MTVIKSYQQYGNSGNDRKRLYTHICSHDHHNDNNTSQRDNIRRARLIIRHRENERRRQRSRRRNIARIFRIRVRRVRRIKAVMTKTKTLMIPIARRVNARNRSGRNSDLEP